MRAEKGRRMNHFVKYVRCGAAALVLVVIGFPTSGLTLEEYDRGMLRKDVLYSELVVHGVIVSLGSEMVPYDSLFVIKKPGREFPVTVIGVRIQEVLKGAWPDGEIRAVLTGDPKVGGVHMGVSYDYEVGEEVILCLHYEEKIMGGVYRLWGDAGSFVMRGGEWMTRGDDPKVLCWSSIIEQACATDPARMVADADAVVLGTVETIKRQKVGSASMSGTADCAAVRVKEAWKGASTGQAILVRAIRHGTNLSWYAPVPSLAAGESYLMFLKRDDVGFYPFVGFNGFLKVEGEQLIMNGHVTYSIPTSRMRNTIREAVTK
jgi:hypothetical protein